MAIHKFPKSERLCSKKRIEQLFAGGNRSLSAYPLRVIYRELENDSTLVFVLISVSKRRFKHAIDRNRTKRLIREAYRQNKQILTEQLTDKSLDIAFIWMSDERSDFASVKLRVKNLLQRIGEMENIRK